MSEREMREILYQLCADMDRRARALGRTVKKAAGPLALGAGLALSAGACSDDASPTPKPEAGVDMKVNGPDAAYMAPPVEMGVDMSKADLGPLPPYQAPPGPEAGPQPDYMAPDVGPQPDYMAPDGGS